MPAPAVLRWPAASGKSTIVNQVGQQGSGDVLFPADGWSATTAIAHERLAWRSEVSLWVVVLVFFVALIDPHFVSPSIRIRFADEPGVEQICPARLGVVAL